MKFFLIPMFAVIRAETQEEAEQKAGEMQLAARLPATGLLYQDEDIPTREVPHPDHCEFHSILDFYTTEELIR